MRYNPLEVIMPIFQHHQWQGTDKDPTPTPLNSPKPNVLLDWCMKIYVLFFIGEGCGGLTFPIDLLIMVL